MSELFLATTETVPPGVGFGLYSVPHRLWFAALILLACTASLVCRSMDAAGRRRVLRALTEATLILQIAGDAVMIVTGRYALNYLPLDLCGLAIFAEFMDARQDNRLLSELCYCLFMPGAAMALIFPDWVSLPWWNLYSIRSFVIHGLLMAYPWIRIAGGDLRPDARKLPLCFAVGIGMCIPIYVIDKALDQNFFFLNWPSPGSPLELFEKWLGSPGYLAGLPLMLMIIWLLLYLPWGNPARSRKN
jgi:hypothetical integral membrane protein (TIGR02206 family)